MAVFLGCTSTGRVGLCFLWFFVQELLEAQPAVSSASACADPGSFTKWGGGRGSRPTYSKKLGQRFFVIFAAFSPHLQLI